MENTEILNDKIDKLELIMFKIFDKHKLSAEQLLIDFLEKIDYDIEYLRINPFDLQIKLIEIQGKSRSFSRNMLKESDFELLKEIEAIDYFEL